MSLPLLAAGRTTSHLLLRSSRSCASTSGPTGLFQARGASEAIVTKTLQKLPPLSPSTMLPNAQNVTMCRVWFASSMTSSQLGQAARVDNAATAAAVARQLSPLMAEYVHTAPVVRQLIRKTLGGDLSSAKADSLAQHLTSQCDAAVLALQDRSVVGALFMGDMASSQPDYPRVLGMRGGEPLTVFRDHVKDLIRRCDPLSLFNEYAAWYCGPAIVYRHFRGDLGLGVRVFDLLVSECEAMAVDRGYRLTTAVILSDVTAKRIERRGWARLGEMRYDRPPLVGLVDAETAKRHGSLSFYALRLNSAMA